VWFFVGLAAPIGEAPMGHDAAAPDDIGMRALISIPLATVVGAYVL